MLPYVTLLSPCVWWLWWWGVVCQSLEHTGLLGALSLSALHGLELTRTCIPHPETFWDGNYLFAQQMLVARYHVTVALEHTEMRKHILILTERRIFCATDTGTGIEQNEKEQGSWLGTARDPGGRR